MRLIDADALVAKLEDDAEHMEDPIAAMFTYGAISDIKHAETVDVQPKDEVTKAFSDGFEAGYKCGYERGREDGR